MISARAAELCMSRSILQNAVNYLRAYGLHAGDLDARELLLDRLSEQHEEYQDCMYPASRVKRER